MPSYKVVYFNARGRAEPARMMFALKGVKFEDERLEAEEWPKRKADKAGLYGANSLEGAWIDVVMATMGDIEEKLIPVYVGNPDEAKKAEMMKAFLETTSKPYFSYLDQLMKDAGGKFFVGNKISLADIHIFNMLDMMTNSKYKIDGILDQYPALTAFCKFFREEGPLKEYLKSRPVTEA